MSISMFSASVPIFQKTLGNLAHCLRKAQAHADEKKFSSDVLVQARLFPDMLPFSKQIQIASDSVKFGPARLAGIEAPKFEDNETTLAQLIERVQKTLDFLATLKPAQLDGTEGKDITFPVGKDKTHTMKGEDYLRHWVLPNFFFHVGIAYALLRHNGVPLGKMDYLAGDAAQA